MITGYEGNLLTNGGCGRCLGSTCVVLVTVKGTCMAKKAYEVTAMSSSGGNINKLFRLADKKSKKLQLYVG